MTLANVAVPKLILTQQTGAVLPTGLVQMCVSQYSISLRSSTYACAEHNCIFHSNFISTLGATHPERGREEESLTGPFALRVSLPAPF